MNAPQTAVELGLEDETTLDQTDPSTDAPSNEGDAPASAGRQRQTYKLAWAYQPAGDAPHVTVTEMHRLPDDKWQAGESRTFELAQFKGLTVRQLALRGLKDALTAYVKESTLGSVINASQELLAMGTAYFDRAPGRRPGGRRMPNVEVTAGDLMLAYCQIHLGWRTADVQKILKPMSPEERKAWLTSDPNVVAQAARIRQAYVERNTPAEAPQAE